MQLRRVVVTGLGALTPIGNDVQSFFNGLRSGTSGAGLITHFDTEKFKVKSPVTFALPPYAWKPESLVLI